MRLLRISFVFIILLYVSRLFGQDWPIYKGNIYFTGNNDEVIVKNNNLKWLYQAGDRVFNPVVSDGRVYFLDLRGFLYCLDEEYGKLIWKQNIREVSRQFSKLSRAAGKVKYPLIKGNTLFLTDPVAIYAFNKITGRVLWARTGMRLQQDSGGLYNKGVRALVDGIYSDPVLHENSIYYGTRKMFLAREILNGHEQWENNSIQSYSGFPTFYDYMIFTQSMNYSTGAYTVHCLDSATGNEKWSKRIEKPMKIFPPVIYKRKLYVPTGQSIYCLDIKDGSIIWSKNYGSYITSNPSFTDRAILFSIDNSDIAVIDPENGSITKRIKTSPKAGPLYITVRDQIYFAYNNFRNVKNKKVPYGIVKAVDFSESRNIWNYKTPFPGAISQPIASKGILFLPAGNYLYAIGTEYYARVVDGGSGFAVPPGKEDSSRDVKPPDRRMGGDRSREDKKIRTRKMDVDITDKNGRGIPAEVDITRRDKGRIVYRKRVRVDKKGKIDVPVGGGSELIITAPGYMPKKVEIDDKDKKKKIVLEKIEEGKGIVVENIHFEFDKWYLKKKSLDILDRIIKVMKGRPDLKMEVRGHTDSTGKPSYNKKLSEKRADAVVEYMIKNGISPERLISKGFGETKPIASNKTKEGRKKNRRTEFYILKQ